MKIINVKSLEIPEIKVIKYGRFPDHRGYFTELYRKSDFDTLEEMSFMKGIEFVQVNESFSKKSTVRGLHFQWNPFIGKLLRVIMGRMFDLVLDIRKGSPTAGKIIAYDMPASYASDTDEWIWIPPGFAHGNFFPEDTAIQYFCSGKYNPACEMGISPLSEDIDWSICNKESKKHFDKIISGNALISDKDKDGLSLTKWMDDERSDNFIYMK